MIETLEQERDNEAGEERRHNRDGEDQHIVREALPYGNCRTRNHARIGYLQAFLLLRFLGALNERVVKRLAGCSVGFQHAQPRARGTLRVRLRFELIETRLQRTFAGTRNGHVVLGRADDMARLFPDLGVEVALFRQKVEHLWMIGAVASRHLGLFLDELGLLRDQRADERRTDDLRHFRGMAGAHHRTHARQIGFRLGDVRVSLDQLRIERRNLLVEHRNRARALRTDNFGDVVGDLILLDSVLRLAGLFGQFSETRA